MKLWKKQAKLVPFLFRKWKQWNRRNEKSQLNKKTIEKNAVLCNEHRKSKMTCGTSVAGCVDRRRLDKRCGPGHSDNMEIFVVHWKFYCDILAEFETGRSGTKPLTFCVTEKHSILTESMHTRNEVSLNWLEGTSTSTVVQDSLIDTRVAFVYRLHPTRSGARFLAWPGMVFGYPWGSVHTWRDARIKAESHLTFYAYSWENMLKLIHTCKIEPGHTACMHYKQYVMLCSSKWDLAHFFTTRVRCGWGLSLLCRDGYSEQEPKNRLDVFWTSESFLNWK